MMLIREQDRVRLISRGGYAWAKHFPLIVAAALKLRRRHFVLDGEVVVLDKYGVSDFDALASRKHDKQAQFYAFDMPAGEGEGYRGQALLLREANLARLLKRRVDGIFIAEYEQGGGDVLFRVACNMNLEGIVSKRLDRAYGAGRCKHWVKVKNPAHPAYNRVVRAVSLASRVSQCES
jgi:bifunctional non-homologous end joining protein LigD